RSSDLIQHPLSRRLMKSAASLADYRSYRDTVSKEFMESIGFDTRKDAIYPDIAFKLPVPPPAPAKSSDGRLVVGIGVMTYLGWRNDWTRGAPIYRAYLEKITSFAIWLLDCGHTVRILMGDTNDRRAVRDVVARIKEARPNLTDGRLLFAEIASLHDLMGQIGGTDVVVATRFHNIVCALKLGKPSISIGYADKNDALMAEMGLGELCQHIEDFDVDRLIAQFGQLVSDRARYERVLRRANLAIRERLEHQDALLAASLP